MDLLRSLLFLLLDLACFLPPLVVQIALMLSYIEAAVCSCELFTLRNSLLAVQCLTRKGFIIIFPSWRRFTAESTNHMIIGGFVDL